MHYVFTLKQSSSLWYGVQAAWKIGTKLVGIELGGPFHAVGDAVMEGQAVYFIKRSTLRDTAGKCDFTFMGEASRGT